VNYGFEKKVMSSEKRWEAEVVYRAREIVDGNFEVLETRMSSGTVRLRKNDPIHTSRSIPNGLWSLVGQA
jgi:hypothetical protein